MSHKIRYIQKHLRNERQFDLRLRENFPTLGKTMVTKSTTTPRDAATSIAGYAIADVTFLLSSCSFLQLDGHLHQRVFHRAGCFPGSYHAHEYYREMIGKFSESIRQMAAFFQIGFDLRQDFLRAAF